MKDKYGMSWLERINSAGELRSPFLLTDIEVIKGQCRLFRKNFPRISLYYAVKAFSSKEVLYALDGFVDGYDAASMAEINLLLEIGVSPTRINFSNPVKSESSIRQAAEKSIYKFAFQSKGELEKIARNAAHAEVYARVELGNARDAQNFSSKFGCTPDDTLGYMLYAQQIGLKPTGVTFHVGSQATDVSAWGRAIQRAQTLLKAMRSQGVDVQLINIGGGLPVQYKNEDPSIADVADAINVAIDACGEDFSYIAEPGRFLVADSSVVVATVIGREDRGGEPWLFLDAGAFQAFFEIFEFNRLLQPVYSLRHLELTDGTAHETYTLTGPSCDSYDTLSHDVRLPKGIKEGDKLMFTKAGAYTVAYGSNFNGFAVPSQHYVKAEVMV